MSRFSCNGTFTQQCQDANQRAIDIIATYRLVFASMARHRTDPGLTLAINAFPFQKDLAGRLGLTPQAVSRWSRIPPEWVIPIENVTGIPREKLRPDLYAAPRPRKRPRASAAHV